MKQFLALPALLMLVGCSTPPVHPPRSGLDVSGFDRTIRPQDDLYRFAGGGWLARTQIPPDLSNYGTFTEIDEAVEGRLHGLLDAAVRAQPAPGTDARKAADFYSSFMDSARIDARGLTPLRAVLARIDAISGSGDVVRYIGYNQALGIGEPLAWSAPQDPGNARAYVQELDQSGLTMPDRDYYLLDEPKYREYRGKFTAYVAAMLELAGTAQAEAEADAQKVLALETALARAQWTRVQNRDAVRTYNRMTPEQVAKLAPQIDWSAFFAAVGAPLEPCVISQPSFVAALGGMLDTVPIADWRVYFRFRLLDDYAAFLPSAYDQLHFDFHQRTLSGVQVQRPRWKRALALLDGNIGEITGRMYVERYFPPQAKRRIRELVDNLLRAYARSIDELDWMGPETRAQARLKLSRILVKVGYPDKWRDYSALDVSPADLMGNVMRSAQFDLQRHIKRLHAPVDRGEWGMTPQTVNAYYNPTMNEIVFPAAILQPPFFDPDADDAANYGGIGAVIGHEISHGFDDQGRRFDADGNLRDWWTPQDAARFKARTAALVAQYGAYTVLDGVHVNGELTLGENIADVSGLAIAYKAYRISLRGRPAPVIDGFTGAQRFFLGWGQIWRRKYRDDNLRMRILVDPHSPNEFRANGAASDSDAFYEAFGLAPADRLYRAPDQRVKIW